MNAWFPGGAIQAIFGKIVPLCGAAQHTGVWGVPRPDVDRVCDREHAFRHIKGGIQRSRNRIVERDGQQTPPPPEESVLHGPSEEWRLRLSPESCKFTKKAHTIIAPAPPCTRRDDEEAAPVASHEVRVRGILRTLCRCKRCRWYSPGGVRLPQKWARRSSRR